MPTKQEVPKFLFALAILMVFVGGAPLIALLLVIAWIFL